MKPHCIDETCAVCTLDRIHAYLRATTGALDPRGNPPTFPIMHLIYDYRRGTPSLYKDVTAVVEFPEPEEYEEE